MHNFNLSLRKDRAAVNELARYNFTLANLVDEFFSYSTTEVTGMDETSYRELQSFKEDATLDIFELLYSNFDVVHNIPDSFSAHAHQTYANLLKLRAVDELFAASPEADNGYGDFSLRLVDDDKKAKFVHTLQALTRHHDDFIVTEPPTKPLENVTAIKSMCRDVGLYFLYSDLWPKLQPFDNFFSTMLYSYIVQNSVFYIGNGPLWIHNNKAAPLCAMVYDFIVQRPHAMKRLFVDAFPREYSFQLTSLYDKSISPRDMIKDVTPKATERFSALLDDVDAGIVNQETIDEVSARHGLKISDNFFSTHNDYTSIPDLIDHTRLSSHYDINTAEFMDFVYRKDLSLHAFDNNDSIVVK